MTAFVITGAVVAGAGAVGFLVYYLIRERQRSHLEQEQQFRTALMHELQRRGTSEFEFRDFVRRCKVPGPLAKRVAEDVYGRFYSKALADDRITEAERRQLNALGQALSLNSQILSLIEQRSKEDRYVAATSKVLADGDVTAEEVAELKQLRRSLGLSSADAAQITREVSADAYLALFRRVASDGRLTKAEMAELERYKAALAMSEDEANEIVQEDALKLYRQWFFNIVQDGEVRPEEEKALDWLQKQFGLSTLDTKSYKAELECVKRLAAYRRSELPTISTTKILESGELCHWEGRCRFEWYTATKVKEAAGDLVVTSEQVVFTSAIRSFSFAPAKIMDIRAYSDGLVIQTSGNKGTGRYFVVEPRELEAVLVGLVRKHKFLLSESFSSAHSRHIPDSVRRDVWERDQGRCVRCSASEYLEYDHIIPHARGGANTVDNVQILCRKCNLLKSDRI